jgi:hypothetical protein
LTWLARLLWGGRARHAQRPARPATVAVRPAAWATARASTRPRVALAIQAAYAAQASRAVPAQWAVYGWGRELDEQQSARNPFDARRAQAWQAIDLTLAELRAS